MTEEQHPGNDISPTAEQLHAAHPAVAAEELEQAANRIQDLLIDLSASFPLTTGTDRRLFLEKFAQASHGLPDACQIITAAGLDYVRFLCPAAGIPPTMARRIYEILQQNSSQAGG
ncbi:MAG: hypothetical protein ACTS2F_16710 [Thainema sp.]